MLIMRIIVEMFSKIWIILIKRIQKNELFKKMRFIYCRIIKSLLKKSLYDFDNDITDVESVTRLRPIFLTLQRKNSKPPKKKNTTIRDSWTRKLNRTAVCRQFFIRHYRSSRSIPPFHGPACTTAPFIGRWTFSLSLFPSRRNRARVSSFRNGYSNELWSTRGPRSFRGTTRLSCRPFRRLNAKEQSGIG